MFIIDPYCFLFNQSNSDYLGIFEKICNLIDFIEKKNLYSKTYFPDELIQELMKTFPYNDPTFSANYQFFYSNLSKTLPKFVGMPQDKGAYYNPNDSNLFQNNLYSGFSDFVQKLIWKNLFYLLNIHGKLLVLKINCSDAQKEKLEVELIDKDKKVLTIKRRTREQYKEFLPYFVPSDKHKNYKPVGKNGTTLEKEDEEDCYDLINYAVRIKDQSMALVAYNQNTGKIIKFPITHGFEYHAFPVDEEYYRTLILPYLNQDILK